MQSMNDRWTWGAPQSRASLPSSVDSLSPLWPLLDHPLRRVNKLVCRGDVCVESEAGCVICRAVWGVGFVLTMNRLQIVSGFDTAQGRHRNEPLTRGSTPQNNTTTTASTQNPTSLHPAQHHPETLPSSLHFPHRRRLLRHLIRGRWSRERGRRRRRRRRI
jgi:hypothetical protein